MLSLSTSIIIEFLYSDVAICMMQIETCRKVENVLKRFDRKGSMIRVLPFHAALDHETRLANMEEFRGSQMENSALFLVCTDRYYCGFLNSTFSF